MLILVLNIRLVMMTDATKVKRTQFHNKPDPLRPVIHTTHPFWLISFCLSNFPTGHSCQNILLEFPKEDIGILILPLLSTVRQGNQRPLNREIFFEKEQNYI
jgi:hypothetical protein